MKRPFATSVIAIAAAISSPSFAQPSDAASSPGNSGSEIEDIVVTGTLSARAPTSVAVSTLRADDISKTVPVSAVDLLRSVPGVYVNSALGEIRNVVYSRGISANSNDAAAGYYYVSLQEDGLPVTNVTFNNYGPDYFYRDDLSLARLEALRGGSAVVTGPNSPGGIFNYISKTGRSAEGTEIRLRGGLLGNGRNPYYRADATTGGKIGTNDLYYSVTGFYRYDRGPRDGGYAMNRGGQIKANLFWDYGDGSVLLYGKYLDDHNGVNLFQPGVDFSNPRLAPGISRYDSLMIPRAVHDFQPSLGASSDTWDGERAIHSISKVIGLKNEHKFGDGWTITNNLKFSHNKSDWNAPALTFVVPLTDGFLNTNLNTRRPGIYSYYNHNTGQLLAQVGLAGGVRTVLSNNLPNQQVLQNGITTQVPFNFHPSTREVMDQVSITKAFDRGNITFGGFFAYSDVKQSGGGAGIGMSTIEDQPSLIDIRLTTPGGVVQQVTSPEGFAGIGQRFGATPFTARQLQASAFAGGDFELTDKLKIDGAVRYDYIRVKGRSNVAVPNPRGTDPTYGGIDGNPNTLYDNFAVTYASPGRYRFPLDYVSFSGALTYQFDNRNGIYARFSQGKKAPDLGFFVTYDTLAKLATQVPVPQQIRQIEAGYKMAGSAFRLSVTPFYSRLSNVGSQEFGTRADGSSYAPPTLFSTTTTYGLEVEGDVDFANVLNFRTALTLQKSKSKDFATYNFGAPGEADDVAVRVPDGDADNTPKVMATSTLTYSPVEAFDAALTWRYMGSRPANRYNAFDLPAYSEFNLNATWRANERFTVNASINNLFNQRGVLAFAPAGSLLSALNRQALTPAQVATNPNQTFSILENQPRSMYLTVGYKF